MCLIIIANNIHPAYKYIIVANRDEYYERPTKAAHFWEEHPQVLAGKDLKAGGTWLGVNKAGKLTALTNYRDPNRLLEQARSRGDLTKDFLEEDTNPLLYMMRIQHHATEYNGFNLITGDKDDLFYYSNYEMIIKKMNPGLYGLSNHLLDTPWPKVVLAKNMISDYLNKHPKVDPNALLDIMQDSDEADDMMLPFTGVPIEWEKKLSPMFIKTLDYGTCSSSVILWDHQDHITFVDRVYNTPTQNPLEQRFAFDT